MIGTQLSHFKITAKLGEGGMGEVYRAEDTKLDREVAIKVLPEAVSQDPERLARFEREAKVLASLNHPNIAGIHQVEQADGVHFLVMELAPGEDLAERLSHGPIPVDEAVTVALQIAEAVEAAHEAGVIHRDLKPANIKVDSDGNVKVLDFGLAKALEPATSDLGAGLDPAREGASPSPTVLSMSPTLTAQMTGAGVILGTSAYMSPEQARGKPVDKRSDIWAFGVVLWEMLTGQRLFNGETVTDVLAEVVKSEPDLEALPADASPALRRLIERCLIKDPKNRLRDIGEARIELISAEDRPDQDEDGPGKAGGLRWGMIAATAILGIGFGALLGSRLADDSSRKGSPMDSRTAIRGTINLAADAPLAYGAALIGFDSPMLALSPDGQWLVHIGRGESGPQLYLRDLTGFEPATLIEGTEGALFAFFSPGGEAIGFLTRDKVKRVSRSGDELQTIGDVQTATRADWLDDGWIYLAQDEGTRVIRFPAGGGAAEEIYNLKYAASYSEVFHGGKWMLATNWSTGISGDFSDIYLVDLETTSREVILPNGYDARYLPTGHLLFARGGNLLAVRFDLASGRVSGEPVTVVRNVAMDSFFRIAQVAVSASGALAFAPGGERALGRIAWLDREGNEGLLDTESRIYGVLDLDEADRRIAVHIGDVRDYVWIYDLEGSEVRSLRADTSLGWPSWSWSGDKIAVTGNTSSESWGVMIAEVDQVAEPVELISSDSTTFSTGGWSPDGSAVAVDKWEELHWGVQKLDGTEVEWFRGWGAVFSPDGKWIAYSSPETGVQEIWVRSWPDGDVVRQISSGGGLEPRWCPCDQLFYREADRFWSVQIQTEPELVWQKPELVWNTDFLDTPGRSFDISSDGQRIYLIKQAKPDVSDQIRIVANWFDELERLVPAAE